MKTKFKLLVGLIISVIMLGSQFSAFAADIPIKKVMSIGADVLVLAENGDLYFADSIDASTKTRLYRNVNDVYAQGAGLYVHWYVCTNDNRIIDLFDPIGRNDGDYTNIKTEEFEGSVKTPISLPSLYIDTNDSLISDGKIILKNVLLADGEYALTSDGVFYRYLENYVLEQPQFIMSEVKEFKDDVVLKNNGDLYLLDGNNINKVLSNVNNLSTYYKSGWNDYRDYFIVDANNNFYHIDYAKGVTTPNLISQNIKTLLEYDYKIHPLDIYGNLYIYDQNWNEYKQIDTKGQKIGNVIVPWRKEVYFTENNNLLKNFSPVYEVGKIKSVVDMGQYVYINELGEVWISDRDMTTFEKTQLSEKSTILKINGKVCELENKLQLINGRTMYPFRECLNLIGANVYWDGENQIAIGEIPGIKIEFPIGKSEYYVNGVKHEMDTSAYVDESIGRTYIPIRYAAEGLGFTVDWIPGDIENTISIHK